MILAEARKHNDDLNDEANRLKLDVLCEAQIQANAKVEATQDHQSENQIRSDPIESYRNVSEIG